MRGEIWFGVLGALALSACGDDDGPANSGDAVAPDVDLADTAEPDIDLGGAKRVFLTATRFDGDLGGPTGADTRCMEDPLRPSTGSYKALLAGGGRMACEDPHCETSAAQQDWVLAADADYVLPDGTPLFSTDARGVISDYPLLHAVGHGINFWAGLHEDWTSHAESCDGWTTASDEVRGRVGWAEGTNERWVQGGAFTCERRAPLVCVEQ